MVDFRKDPRAVDIGGSANRLEAAALEEAKPWSNLLKRYLFLMILWLYAVIGMVLPLMANHQIALREKTTTGAIVGHDAANRHTSVYVFSIDKNVYTGQEVGSEHTKIGEQVVVYYDPDDPEKNRLKDFEEEALGFLGILSVVLILSGAGIFFLLKQRRNRVQRQIF